MHYARDLILCVRTSTAGRADELLMNASRTQADRVAIIISFGYTHVMMSARLERI